VPVPRPDSQPLVSLRALRCGAKSCLAEVPDVGDINEAKVTVAGRVPAELATSIARMAADGNRTISREVWAALQEHVEQSSSAKSLLRRSADGRGDPSVVAVAVREGEEAQE
jgi:hypothetical protein